MNIPKTAKIIGVLAIVGLLGCWAANDYFAGKPKIEPDPNPNGYVDLIAAGKMLSGYPDKETLANLRLFVGTNQAALERARVGLARQCRVPAARLTETAYMDGSKGMELMAVKRLALTFVAAGQIAEADNKPSEAAQDYCDCARVGMQLAHGGGLIDALFDVACESMGVSHLQAVLPKLNAADCRQSLEQLKALEVERETHDDVLRHEAAAFHWTLQDRVMYLLYQHKEFDRTWAKYDAQRVRTQKLESDLAQRARP